MGRGKNGWPRKGGGGEGGGGGLIDDEDLRYAIAYAQFKTGEFDAAERHLALLSRPDLFRKAAELRRAMQDCRGDRWKCL